MKYGRIPYVNKPLSRIVFGTYIKPMIEDKDVFELLDEIYYEAGVNVFDSAACYGEAEASLGRWVKARDLREKIVILTKGSNTSKYRHRLTEHDIMTDIEDSFAKLQTDFIDIYILHRDNPDVPVGPIVELLNKLHLQGRIGAFGGSNWTLERTKDANSYANEHGLIPFSVCSPSFSLAECIGDPWGGSVTISGPKHKDYRDYLKTLNIPVFSYSSLARGFLSGKLKSSDEKKAKDIIGYAADEYGYPVNYEKLERAEEMAAEKNASVSEIALSWLMHQELNIYAITSPSSTEHIRSTTRALDIPLTETELKWLNLEI